MRHHGSAHSAAAAENAKNGAGQPPASMSAGLSPNASAVPTCASAITAPTAPARRRAGTARDSSWWIAGNATPWLAPAAARAASSHVSGPAAAAAGVSADAADQPARPAASTRLPP